MLHLTPERCYGKVNRTREEPDMFFVPKNTAMRRPAAVWSGFPPRSRTRPTTDQPCGCQSYVRRPFRHSLGVTSALGRCPRDLLDTETSRLPGRQAVNVSTCHRTLGRSASVRQGVALDPSRSLQAPLKTMLKGAAALPFKTHVWGYFALPWPPSTNPARVEIRTTGCPVKHHQRDPRWIRGQ